MTVNHNLVVVAAVIFLIGLGLAEYYLHRGNLRRIAYRIHINGTRGKTSTTRLVTAALQEAGVRTCGKTSGTIASVTLPDGKQYPVYRPGRANIIEQLRIVAVAAAYEARALVIECMALQPHLQSLCEFKMVQATHGIITNIRADHLDVMGPDERGVGLALAGMVPVNGKLFTCADRHLDVLEAACHERGTQLVRVLPEEFAQITDAEMARFAYSEHKENVALVLRLCADLGIDRETALRGMTRLKPDEGNAIAHEIEFFGRRITFFNAFAANDPESTERLWRYALDKYPHVNRRVAVLNCRADRPDRSRQFGEIITNWQPADAYVLMGTGTFILAREAARHGLDTSKIVMAEGKDTAELFETIIEVAGDSALIVGMINIHGGGLELVRHFRNRAIVSEAV